MRRFVSLSLLALFLAACTDAPAPPPAPPEAPPVAVTTYDGVGVVKNITPSKSHIILDHEAIPDLMGPMTMPFPIKDATLLEGIAPQDSVRFTVSVAGDDVYVSALGLMRE